MKSTGQSGGGGGKDTGRTLPGAGPVQFHRRWRQRESVTAEKRQKTEEEEEEEGAERERETREDT